MMNLKTVTAVCVFGLMSGFVQADEMAQKADGMKDEMAPSMAGHAMKKDDMSGNMGQGMKDQGMIKDPGVEDMAKGGMMDDKMHEGMSKDAMAKGDKMKPSDAMN